MTQRPPQRPTAPPLPDLSTYRPIEERQAGPPPPIDQRFRQPMVRAAAKFDRRPRPKPKRKLSWVRILAWTIGVVGAVAAAGVAALVAFAPVGMIREQLIREVQVRTGRDLVIAGRTSLTVFPSLGLTMGDVSLSAPPGMGGPPFVKMKQLDILVPVMPLLSRKVAVDRLVLTEPVFELRVDARGQRSWDFAALALAPTIMVAQASSRQQQGAGGSTQVLPPELQDFLRNSTTPEQQPASTSRSAAISDIALGDVRIHNGTVRYRDERAGVMEDVRAINARLSGKSLASPIEAKGDLVLRAEKVDFEGRIGSPKALLEERPSRVAVSINAPRVTGRYEGSLSIAKGPQLDGNLKLDAASVRGLATWLGARLPEGPGLGAFGLQAELKTGASWLALNNAKTRLDEIEGTGSANLDWVGGRPNLKANLRLATVDLNPYLGPAGNEAPVAATPPLKTIAPAGPVGKQGPQVKGFTQRSGWSDQPIELAALGLLDAELRLSMAGLIYRDMKLGATQLGLALKSSAMRVNFDDVKLYGGQGKGFVTVEPSGRAAAMTANLTLDGVAGLQLLKDVAGFQWIDGKAKVQLAVGGTGATQRAIMETLSGKAEFGFADGAIIGFNIPQMIRGVSQGRLSGFNRTPTERTDFSEAGASFQIRNGVAETKDLRAMSPLLRLTGAGTVNLGQRQIDTTLRPKLVGSLSGQGGGGDLSGLELPVRVKGPWENPQVAPDMDGLLKNPNQAVDTIREIGRQIQQGKGGGLNNLIEQFRRK